MPFGGFVVVAWLYSKDILLTEHALGLNNVQCSGKFSNVLHSNIINLVANDFYPTLTDWIVTTLYVCRIANAQLFALPLSLLVCPSGSAHNTHQWMDGVGWGGGSEINFSEINCRISRINCKRFSNTLHSSLCGQLKWLLKIKISKSKNSIRYFRFGQPKILKRHTHTRYAYRFGNKSPGCDLLVTGASH